MCLILENNNFIFRLLASVSITTREGIKENVDLIYSQKEHHAKNRYEAFKNEEFWPGLGNKFMPLA